MPRSVIRAVTRRAGVTSNAGLAAAAPLGVRDTCTTRPSSVRPGIRVTSAAARSSMGTSAMPSRKVQSMVGPGSAT
jgi:hypothetical protein